MSALARKIRQTAGALCLLISQKQTFIYEPLYRRQGLKVRIGAIRRSTPAAPSRKALTVFSLSAYIGPTDMYVILPISNYNVFQKVCLLRIFESSNSRRLCNSRR